MMAPLFSLPARRPSARGLLALAAIGAACALLPGCGKSSAEAPPAAEPAPPVVQSGQLRFPAGHPQLALLGTADARAAKDVAVELPARLVWNEERTQRIYPAFAGRVTTMHADLGQAVKAGAPLALLASPDFGQAQADTAKATALQSLSQQSLKRQRELFEAGIVARKDLEQAEADAAGARAEVARAAARTRLYGGGGAVNQQLALTAGIGGVVVERNLNPGQEVRPDQSGPALFVVTDPTSLWVQIDAREADLASLRPGDGFVLQVPAYPGASFSGKVTATADAIDPGSRTIKVRGVVPNADRRLKAEMLATARVQESRANGVVVPAAAIVLDGTQHVVYVRREAGVFEQRKVTLAQEGPGEVIIASGLQAGEAVVSQNALLLARQFQAAAEDAAVAKKAAP
ncbi:efflux RND transporter periplasmic adaptor subunit [Acidovorax sp. GBBC 3334]|uniref:efflux RND transporter periplasmic adaptor subunit n=1 Tax=Acidovorax sp. GBBC 3334 TaxID=2940496 RepID=UPI002304D029|nr:efflux RND transporter periplasmic adaptor subunit [Acidovorax sp. GBBC 3334]MDA8454930.1 efflux RND transporter periplasmic adaptor subunit [Acidovorax sp. GBBC 3334]